MRVKSYRMQSLPHRCTVTWSICDMCVHLWWVLYDGFGLFETAGAVKFFQGGERAANDFLCCLCDPLKLLTVPQCSLKTRHRHSMTGCSQLSSDRRTPAVFGGCCSSWELSESKVSAGPSSLAQWCVRSRSGPPWCWLPGSGSWRPSPHGSCLWAVAGCPFSSSWSPRWAPWSLMCWGASF